MTKPSDVKIWLYDSWPITKISVNYKQTGTDTADTFVIIGGRLGKKELAGSTVHELLDIRLSYNSIAQVKSHIANEVKEWKAFATHNKKDLAEFARLQKKLFSKALTGKEE